ncbi:MAG TPA: methyltransferase domain-containing protein, partial [Acidimicrobiales bacterium]
MKATETESAAARWAEALGQWAVPEEILQRAPVAPWVHPPALFKVDVEAEVPDTPSHRAARAALGDGGSVLDVGCGGGGSSLPLAPPATRLVGVDEQQGMLDNFAAACEAVGVSHAEVVGKWPDVADRVEVADVVVCHHVAYNVAAIGP